MIVKRHIGCSRRAFGRLCTKRKYEIGVEVGVLRGTFSEFLLKNTDLKKLYCVDLWDEEHSCEEEISAEEIFKEAAKRLSAYGDRVTILRYESVLAARLFEDKSIDFIYIDADHSYSAVVTDLQEWMPKVRIGGMLAGHDFQDVGRTKQVSKALETVIGDSIPIHTTRESICASWWITISPTDNK